MRSEGGELGEHRLYLAGEYIDATDDEHVVAATQHLAHPHCGASALARLVDKAGEVAGAVAQYRHGLLAQRGDDQLTHFARSNGLEGLGVNNLGQEHILPHMGAVLIQTLTAYAGTAHLGKAVDVDSLDVQLGLQLAAYAPGPGLGTEEAYAQLEILGGNFVFLYHLSQVESIGRRAAEGCGAEVLHEHYLLLRVA